MGCLKLTYQDNNNHLKVVYSNAFALENNTQRFLSVDPLADKYPSLSPYNFVAGNPIMFIDADGREITFPEVLGQHALISVKNVQKSLSQNAGVKNNISLTTITGRIEFATSRDARRAQRFLARNANSTDNDVLELMTFYRTVISVDDEKYNVKFEFGPPNASNAPVDQSGNKIIVNQQTYNEVKVAQDNPSDDAQKQAQEVAVKRAFNTEVLQKSEQVIMNQVDKNTVKVPEQQQQQNAPRTRRRAKTPVSYDPTRQ